MRSPLSVRHPLRPLALLSALVAALALPAQAAPPKGTAPRPAPTDSATISSDIGQLRRALAHPQGQRGALAAMARPDANTLKAARNGGHGRLLASLAADARNPLDHRLRALRLAPLYQAPPALLVSHLSGTDPSPAGVALAREAARALAALGRADLLTEAAAHEDPEVRAFALGAGADPRRACAALGVASEALTPEPTAPEPTAPPPAAAPPDTAPPVTAPPVAAATPLRRDPWPFVRRAAASGLGASVNVGPCIAAGLADSDPSVVEAAVVSAGQSNLAELRTPLLNLAGKAQAPVGLRAEAVVALAHLGDTTAAQRILQTHRAKGGIEPLALGAVRALAQLGGPANIQQLLELTEKSSSSAVRIAATETLVGLQPEAADGLLKRRIAQAKDIAERRQLEALRARVGPATEAVPDLSPSEDDEPD